MSLPPGRIQQHRAKKPGDKDGYIELLWKGTVVIEMKIRGKSLDKAFEQAKVYLHGMKGGGNHTKN